MERFTFVSRILQERDDKTGNIPSKAYGNRARGQQLLSTEAMCLSSHAGTHSDRGAPLRNRSLAVLDRKAYVVHVTTYLGIKPMVEANKHQALPKVTRLGWLYNPVFWGVSPPEYNLRSKAFKHMWSLSRIDP